ncbi:hypothetical protein [Algoriphagus sp.]|uniref:hypothetical protein n=1 Tax=Algoriphagus sp. TaxID=1872435 RepID=UPI0039190DAF
MHGRIFKEEQTYKGTWVMYFILMLEIPTLVLVTFLVLNDDSGRKEGIYGLISFFLIMIIVSTFLFKLKLKTRIDETGIHYAYFPLIKWRTISKKQIKSAELIMFNPLADHGGWGIKGNKTTKAYTVIGDAGLSIDLGEKKKIVIGTQKPKELGEFLENWMKG